MADFSELFASPVTTRNSVLVNSRRWSRGRKGERSQLCLTRRGWFHWYSRQGAFWTITIKLIYTLLNRRIVYFKFMSELFIIFIWSSCNVKTYSALAPGDLLTGAEFCWKQYEIEKNNQLRYFMVFSRIFFQRLYSLVFLARCLF